MPTIDEAVEAYVGAVKTFDIGTLMATLTPEALGKAMAMGGGGPPTGITNVVAERQGEETNGEYVYNLTVEAASGGGTMMTRWKQVDGAWKVTDLAQV